MRLVVIVMLVACLSSCGKSASDIFTTFKPPKNRTESELFQVGETALSRGYYDVAIKQFEMITSKYPYSSHSEQAQLNLIYAYQMAGDNDVAEHVAERFIRFYPRSKHIDYAYYMRAIASFEQDRGMFFNYLPLDPAERDIHSVKNAFERFATFIRKFPKSDYVGDARQRMIFVRNLLAQREWNVANFYYTESRYLATVNRLNYLIKQYPEAPQIENALGLLVEANLRLGLKKPAEQAYRVLQVNFPNSEHLATYKFA